MERHVLVELTDAGHSCLVIDKRTHIGGNCYTRYIEEADCHEHHYGAHIFHTNSEKDLELSIDSQLSTTM